MPKVPIPNNDKTSLDPFYRYKRDRAEVSVVGQFNVMTNFGLICKQIHVDEKSLQQFMTKKLNQPVMLVMLDEKTIQAIPASRS